MIGRAGKAAGDTDDGNACFFLGHHFRSLRARLAALVHARRHCVVLSAALEFRKERRLISSHEVPNRADAGDRDELGEWIDAEFSFQIGHEKCQVERPQAERVVQLVGGGECADLHRALCQDRTDPACTMDSIFAGVGAVSM